MTPHELLDTARSTTRDRLAEVDTAALKDAAANNLSTARAAAEARLHEAGNLIDEAGHFLEDAGDYLEHKIDEVTDALEDDETRSRVLAIAAAVTGVAILLWIIRRARAKKREAELEEALYESTSSSVAGWTDPGADGVTADDITAKK